MHLTIKEPILFRRNENNTLVMAVSKMQTKPYTINVLAARYVDIDTGYSFVLINE